MQENTDQKCLKKLVNFTSDLLNKSNSSFKGIRQKENKTTCQINNDATKEKSSHRRCSVKIYS